MHLRRSRYIASFALGMIIPAIVLFLMLSPRQMVLTIAVALYFVVFGTIWDVASAKGSHTLRSWIWDFNPKSILGFHIFGLPIEEFVFMFVTPVLIIALWEFFVRMGFSDGVLFGLAAVTVVFAVYLYPKLEKPDNHG